MLKHAAALVLLAISTTPAFADGADLPAFPPGSTLTKASPDQVKCGTMYHGVDVEIWTTSQQCTAWLNKVVAERNRAAKSTGNNDQARLLKCVAASSIYQASASFRDQGMSPQQAFQTQIVWIQNGTVSDRQLKSIINDIYFDPRFENAGGKALHDQTLQICMNASDPNYKPFEPLR